MPRKKKSPFTMAGKFVHKDLHQFRRGKRGASIERAIAVGLSKARKVGIRIPGRKRPA